ncbi:MAG: GAF domain-containing protein, partial [Thermodesulfobacteriota bacterium]
LRFAISAGVAGLMFFTGWQGLTTQPALTKPTLTAVLVTAGVAFLLNILYYLALRGQRNLSAFTTLQLVIDLLIFASYIYRTGGVTSPFAFLFMLPIIAGAILVSGRIATALAAAAAVLYAALAVSDATGLIQHISYFVALDQLAHKWSYVFLMVIVNLFACFTVAALASFLMTAVRSRTQALTEATRRLEQESQRLEMLYHASRAAVNARDQDEVITRIGRLLVDGLNLDRVLFYLVDENKEKLVLAREFYHSRLAGKTDLPLEVEIPLKPEAGLTALCALTRKAENVKDPQNHPLINRELARKIGLNPFAVAPMVAHRELIGVLGIDRKFEEGLISDEDFQILKAFADQAAATLRTARLDVPISKNGEPF